MNTSMFVLFSWSLQARTIENWAIASGIVGIGVVIAKLLYWVSKKYLKSKAAKTRSKFDDIFVDKLEEPIVTLIVLGSIIYAIDYLNFNAETYLVLHKITIVSIILCCTWMLARLIGALMQQYIDPKIQESEKNANNPLISFIQKIAIISIWILGIIVALNNAGFDVAALIAGLGLGGLAFALAAQDSIKNIFGGVTVVLDKPFQLNDRIKLNGIDGFIREIGIRSTKLETLDNRLVIIPNKVFTDSVIENVTSEPTRKVKLILGLTYDTTHSNVQKALDILKNIVESNPKVEDETDVHFVAFNSSSIDVRAIYFIKKDEAIGETNSEINMEILKQFNENKLDFAFPSQTVYMKKENA